MTYHFSKYKFSVGLFYKRIELATIKHTSGIFEVSILPYFQYSGKYHIHSVAQKDNNRTLFLTMQSDDMEPNFDLMNPYNEFYISISHDGRKAMIFDQKMDGIILKN